MVPSCLSLVEIRVRCCRLYGTGIPEMPIYTGCSTWCRNAKAFNLIIQYLLFDFVQNMVQEDGSSGSGMWRCGLD
jgi:hypothetical protein